MAVPAGRPAIYRRELLRHHWRQRSEKSTFLRILSGELDSTSGAISIQPGVRMSVLKQDQFAYDAHTVLDTVIMGNERLYRVGEREGRPL